MSGSKKWRGVLDGRGGVVGCVFNSGDSYRLCGGYGIMRRQAYVIEVNTLTVQVARDISAGVWLIKDTSSCDRTALYSFPALFREPGM